MSALFAGRCIFRARQLSVTRCVNRNSSYLNLSRVETKSLFSCVRFASHSKKNVEKAPFDLFDKSQKNRSWDDIDATFDKSDVVEPRATDNENIDDEDDIGWRQGEVEDEDGILLPDGFLSMKDIYQDEVLVDKKYSIDSADRNMLNDEEYKAGLQREAIMDQLGRPETVTLDERFVQFIEGELLSRQRSVPFEKDVDKKARVREALCCYAKNRKEHPEMEPEKLEKMRVFCGMTPNEYYHIMKPKPEPKPLTLNEHEILFRRFHPKADEFFEEMREEILPDESDLKDIDKQMEISGAIWTAFSNWNTHLTSSKKRKKYEKYIAGRRKKNEVVAAKMANRPKTEEELKKEEIMEKVNPYQLPIHRLNGFGIYFPHILDDYPRDHVTWPLMYEYARALSKNPTYTQREKEDVIREFKDQFLQVDVKALKDAYRKMGLPTTFEKHIRLPDYQDEAARLKWDDFMEAATMQYLDRNGPKDYIQRIQMNIANNASYEVQDRMVESARDSEEK